MHGIESVNFTQDQLVHIGLRLDRDVLQSVNALRTGHNLDIGLSVWHLVRNLILTELSCDYLAPEVFTGKKSVSLSCPEVRHLVLLWVKIRSLADLCMSDCKITYNDTLIYTCEANGHLYPQYWQPLWLLQIERAWDLRKYSYSNYDDLLWIHGQDRILELEEGVASFFNIVESAMTSCLQKSLNSKSICAIIKRVLIYTLKSLSSVYQKRKIPFRVVVDNCMEPASAGLLMAARALGIRACEVNHGSIYEHKYLMDISLAEKIEESTGQRLWLDYLIINDTLQLEIYKYLSSAKSGRAPQPLCTSKLKACSLPEGVAKVVSKKLIQSSIRILYLDTFASGYGIRANDCSTLLRICLEEETENLSRLLRLLPAASLFVRPHPVWGINPVLKNLVEFSSFRDRIKVIDSRNLAIRKSLLCCDFAIVSPRSSSWKNCWEHKSPFIFSGNTELIPLIYNATGYNTNINQVLNQKSI